MADLLSVEPCRWADNVAMDFTSALLLIFDVHTVAARISALDTFTLREHADQYKPRDLILTSARGWMGSRSVFESVTSPPSLFGEPPLGIFLRSEANGEFVIRQTFVQLTSRQLSRLIEQRRSNQDAEIGAFAFSVLPSDVAARVTPPGNDRWYCTLLELVVSPECAVDRSMLASQVRVAMKTDRSVLIPVDIDDVLVLGGPFAGGLEYSVTTVCAHERVEGFSVQMSEIAMNLVNLVVARASVDYLTRRLGYMPLAQPSPSVYVEQLSQGSSADSLSLYTSHLKDREKLLNMMLMSDDLVNVLQSDVDALRTTRCIQNQRVKLYPHVVEAQYASPFAYEPVSILLHDFMGFVTKYRGVKVAAESRDRLIAEYLRDKVNAEVAASNLSIQHTVSRLTILALLLAVVALAEGFLTESAKLALFTQFKAWITHFIR